MKERVVMTLGPGWVLEHLMKDPPTVHSHLATLPQKYRQEMLNETLLHASARGMPSAVKELLGMGAMLGAQDEFGRDALALSLVLNKAQIFNLLMPLCTDPNVMVRLPEWGSNPTVPLICLAQSVVQMKKLLAKGADPKAHTEEGEPIIGWMARAGAPVSNIEALHKAGADLIARDPRGRTVLQRAIEDRGTTFDALVFFIQHCAGQHDPNPWSIVNGVADDFWRQVIQWELIEAGIPIPRSIPYEAFQLDTGSSNRNKDKIRAAVASALMEVSTTVPQETQPDTSNCERCGRAAHQGGCRF